MRQRQLALIQRRPVTPELLERALVDLCCLRRRRLLDLTEEDLASCSFASAVLKRSGRELKTVASEVQKSLVARLKGRFSSPFS